MSKRFFFLKTAVVATSLSALWVAGLIWTGKLRECKFFCHRRAPLTRAEYVKLLRRLSLRFLPVLSDLARIIMEERSSLDKKGLTSVFPIEQLNRMLFDRSGAKERIATIETATLEEFGISEADLSRCSKVYSNDCEVASLEEGLRAMYTDTLSGKLPDIKGLPIPGPYRSQEKVLGLIELIHEHQYKSVEAALVDINIDDEKRMHPTAGSIPSEKLAQRLRDATDRAQSEAMDRIAKENGLNSVFFRHALALHEAEPEFSIKRAALDSNFKDRIVKLMRESPKKSIDDKSQRCADDKNQDDRVKVSIHEALAEVYAVDLGPCLESAGADGIVTVLLILHPDNSNMLALGAMSHAIKVVEYGGAKMTMDEVVFHYISLKEAQSTAIECLQNLKSDDTPVCIVFDGAELFEMTQNVSKIPEVLSNVLDKRSSNTKNVADVSEVEERGVEEESSVNKDKEPIVHDDLDQPGPIVRQNSYPSTVEGAP